VSGALIESSQPLARETETVGLNFTLLAQPGQHQVRINTQALVRNVSVAAAPNGQEEVFAYGVQFTSLDPVHFTMLQNLTYEALLADRQKIV
jgi:hypothetical protein